MKILSVGCGAIGAYFCGRLAQNGAEVAAVLRSDYDAVSASGFQIASIAGDFVFRPSECLHSASEYRDKADFLILSSKVLPQLDRAALIRDAVKPGTVILLIENGVGIEDGIAQAFPENEILSAVAYIGVTRVGPGIVRNGGAGNLTIGRFGGGKSAACHAICAAFRAARVPAQETEDIAFFRWKKLLWNLPFNPVSVIGGGLNTAEMTDRGPVEQLCADLMRETRAVAAACGVELPEKLIAENIEYTRNFPPYKSSMLVDYENGRALEIDAIVGNALRFAHKNNVPVPKMETVYALLSSLDGRKKK